MDSHGVQVEVLSSISSAEDTTPLRGVKAKPCGCSAAQRSLDTPSLAWSEVLTLMEKRKKHVCFLSSYLMLANRKSCIPRNFDRVEVRSPGLLLPGITIEQMERGVVASKLRNPVLASLLRDIPGYMERIGSGIRLMLNETQRMGLPAPQFRELSEFIVTFRKAPTEISQPETLKPEVDKPQQMALDVWPTAAPSSLAQKTVFSDLDKRRATAMRYVQEHGSITNREYRELTGVSEQTANRDLERLVEQGSLIRVGKKRGRRYRLP